MTQYTDIKLTQNDSLEFDIALANQDLVLEDGLETAVIISLFTDTRCDIADLPPQQTSQRGWWGDVVDTDSTDQTGSLLWLLERAKPTDDTLARAEELCKDALTWMIDDGVAKSVTVSASYPTNEEMLIQIGIVEPDGSISNFFYSFAWTQQLQGGT